LCESILASLRDSGPKNEDFLRNVTPSLAPCIQC
jgi:hypothetical protein